MSIKTKTSRGRLKIRNNPYFETLRRGVAVGFRRGPDTWIGRVAAPGGYKFKALDDVKLREASEQYARAVELTNTWAAIAQEVENPRLTVEEAVEDYLEHRRVHKGERSAKLGRYVLQKHLVRAFGRRELASLTRAELQRHYDHLPLRDDSKVQTWGVIKAALNHAYRNGQVPSIDAWRRVTVHKGADRPRTFFLTDEELARLLESADDDLAQLIRGAVHTACRFGELIAATDFDGEVLRVDGKTGARVVRLSDDAALFLGALVPGPGGHLFTRQGRGWRRGEQVPLFRSAAIAAGLQSEVVFYSLRHYALSKQLAAGIAPLLVAKNAGTSVRMLERNYAKWLDADIKAAFNSLNLKGLNKE